MATAWVRFVHNPKSQQELPADPHESELREVPVTKVIQLSEGQYADFVANLQEDFYWLKGNRGETIEVLCTATQQSVIVQPERTDTAKFVSWSY